MYSILKIEALEGDKDGRGANVIGAAELLHSDFCSGSHYVNAMNSLFGFVLHRAVSTCKDIKLQKYRQILFNFFLILSISHRPKILKD